MTKDDALAGSILTLSDLKHLSSCMTKSLDELLIYAKDTIDECSSTNTLLNQIRVINAASTKMEENLTHLTKLEGGVVITKRISSMANADMNIEKKRLDKLHPRKPDRNFVGLNSSKLKSIMKSHTPTKRKHKIVSPQTRHIVLPRPKNGECYTLREAFYLLEEKRINPNQFYNMCTPTKRPALIFCSKSTFYSKYTKYKMTGVLPLVEDEGLNTGRPRLIGNKSIRLLNNEISQTVSYAEDETDLSNKMVSVKESIDEERGLIASSQTTDPNSVKLYQFISWKDNPNIHLVNHNTTMNKSKRRQMASTSIRNLLSHIAAISYSNFRPAVDKWEQPNHLTKGAKDYISIIEKVIGAHIKPIHPAYLLNEDCSSQYYYAGTATDSKKQSKLARATTQTLLDRNKSSIWRNADTEDRTCKGIRVKFACGGSAGGFVYPVVIVLSGLSKDELPNDDFLVVPIEGLSVNGHIDPRNKEVGYMCCLCSNLPQKHFFDWFYENITYPTILEIRRRYNPFRELSTEGVG